jgi:hypothetical protein
VIKLLKDESKLVQEVGTEAIEELLRLGESEASIRGLGLTLDQCRRDASDFGTSDSHDN